MAEEGACSPYSDQFERSHLAVFGEQCDNKDSGSFVVSLAASQEHQDVGAALALNPSSWRLLIHVSASNTAT